MGQVIKVDFRKAAPETATRAPLDERALWAWRERQRATDGPVWNKLGRRLAEARARHYARNILPRGLGVSEYVGNEFANSNMRQPRRPQSAWEIIIALLAA